ncbi:MAG TPA: hypothetical protein VN840_21625 [Streptosporangiaceae bacterium]|nr:hypothetical protein [Streptosporangiaceae bacterium]
MVGAEYLEIGGASTLQPGDRAGWSALLIEEERRVFRSLAVVIESASGGPWSASVVTCGSSVRQRGQSDGSCQPLGIAAFRRLVAWSRAWLMVSGWRCGSAGSGVRTTAWTRRWTARVSSSVVIML